MNRPSIPGRPAGDRAARVAAQERFFRDLVSEMKRVTWPSREEWVAATILTIGLVVSIGLYTYVLDQIFGFVFGKVHGT